MFWRAAVCLGDDTFLHPHLLWPWVEKRERHRRLYVLGGSMITKDNNLTAQRMEEVGEKLLSNK